MPRLLINGKSIFYFDDPQLEGGAAKQTATLFIHGLGSSSCIYKPVTPHLTQITRCIALDTPGSGLSHLGSSPQSVGTIAEDAVALLDFLEVKDKVVVVGHSMGCIVASYIAATFPDRVKGVVLMGPVNPSPALTEVFEQRINVVQNVEWQILTAADGIEYFANTIPTSATGPNTTSLQHAFIRALIIGTSPEGYISLCRVIAEAKPPRYDLIKVPLEILVGEHDKTAPREISETIMGAYGTQNNNKSIDVLANVGHWYCVENPERVQSLVTNFIKKRD
ncbi:uncharacterized protein BP5553_06387 [Venustampulla echinocandica]|uniref:AB hydrolase-1 domain-containing protein n=1 Tax=Venustampulla echinocandica TaxID=2656787 RepID=A0A370TJT0_9HELO|nr:uncharacterized protein BP5553_06387 [Venustampulla echinocandica]RDL35775.1 hypothetical protein BP5553_06387 [Venustampulla echinocandica]